MMKTVIGDLKDSARSGKVTLDAQLRAYDLLDCLCGPDASGACAPEQALEYCSVYDAVGDRLAEVFDPESLLAEASSRLHPFEESMKEARFEAAAAASLHEFAKEVFQTWQTSGIFARRRALRELRHRAGFRLESHRIGNYVAKTFDLMNEAQARFAKAQQAVFANDVSYKCRENLYAKLAARLAETVSGRQDACPENQPKSEMHS